MLNAPHPLLAATQGALVEEDRRVGKLAEQEVA